MKETLIQEAFKALECTYSPYSNFAVGAALIVNDGTIIKGTNIENASFGLTSCAERNALFSAYAQGYLKNDIQAIAIVSKAAQLTSPCGACRQVLSELMPLDAKVFLTNGKQHLEVTVDELLPFKFSSEDLR